MIIRSTALAVNASNATTTIVIAVPALLVGIQLAACSASTNPNEAYCWVDKFSDINTGRGVNVITEGTYALMFTGNSIPANLWVPVDLQISGQTLLYFHAITTGVGTFFCFLHLKS